mgnify:CR=1 FL=1
MSPPRPSGLEIVMAESSLSLGFPDYQKAVGFYLGWGNDSANWSVAQTTRIADIIKSGVRQFYHPPAVDNRPSWIWTFLSPTFTVTTTVSDGEYDLDDNFGGLESTELTFAVNTGYDAAVVIAEAQIRGLRMGTNSNGIPRYCAVRPKTTTGATGQRWEILFWPTPNATLVLTGRCHALQSVLSASYPYALGGEPHVETVLASCVAVAEYEQYENRGERWQRFIERLKFSIDLDAALFTPKGLGYGHDPSNRLRSLRPHQYITGAPVIAD